MPKALSVFILVAVLGIQSFWSSGLRAEEVTRAYKGLVLNANLTLSEGKTLKDGVVLITHGTLAHNKMELIAALQSLLAERGLSSLAINLSLGLDNRHGMYDCAVTHTHKHTDAMGEIGVWLDWLKGKGVSDVILLGHSRGGNQTAWFAVENDDPVIKKVVLVAPMTFDPAKVAKSYKARYKTDLGPLLARAEKLVKEGRGKEVLNNIDFIYCPKTSVAASSFYDYYNGNMNKDTPGIIGDIKKPVLLVIASDDQVVKGLAERMKGKESPTLKIITVEDAGHFFQDLYGEDLADGVAEFIQGGEGDDR